MRDREWSRRDEAISDMEEKNILGKGHKSSVEQLEDFGQKLLYGKAFYAAAKRMRELEEENKELSLKYESEARELLNLKRDIGWTNQ